MMVAGSGLGETLRASYESAGFSRRIGWGSAAAVVVVDAVLAYAEPGSPLYLETGADAVVAMAALVHAAREGGCPTVHTAVHFPRGAADAPWFFAKVPALSVFEGSSRLGGWPEAIAPRSGDWVVKKHYASAFFGTDLASGLTTRGIDTVVVCGFSTSGCVRATALDALQYGFRPMVVRDAVADGGPGPQESNLFDLEAKYADVVSLEEAVGRLRAHRGGRIS